jgi:hypothetical protein
MAEKEPSQKKNAGKSPTMRRQPEDLGRRQTSALLPPRFSRRQRSDFPKVSRSATCRIFVFAPASVKPVAMAGPAAAISNRNEG